MKNKRWFFVGITFLILTIAIIYFFFLKNEFICNDGTSYDKCSTIKPYFCSEGILIENASFCGCSNLSKINNHKCIAEYQNEQKLIKLNYTLNGRKGEINFTVYKNLSDYLSEIPRYIETVDGKEATLFDFKLKSLDEKYQRESLLPLVIAIENSAKNKDDQARIAISIVQNIPFGGTNKTLRIGSIDLEYYRYPYEVLYDSMGVCGEKSELLSFLLRELGYENAFFYYAEENHEAMGIKCPIKKSLGSSGYCFIETTGPSIITDYKTEYVSFGQLLSTPQIIRINEDLTFGENNFYEYGDAKTLNKIRENAKNYGTINYFQHLQFNGLVSKYGLQTFEETF